MKQKLITLLAVCALVLSSCTTVKQTASTAGVETGIYQYPTVADLDIKGKVEARTTWSFRPFHVGEPKLEVAKGNLIAETLKAHDADVLLEPQVIFTRTSYGERVLTISGYPAAFKNFRKATEADIEALKATRGCPESQRTIYNVSRSNFFKKLFGKK